MIPSVFEVKEAEQIDVRVFFEDFDSDLRSWREVANNFYVSSCGVLYREPALLLPTVIHLSRSDGVIEVKANSPSFKLNRRPGRRFLDMFLKLVFAGLTANAHCLLHGGAVRIGKTMVLLLGPPNSGKSTMTWMLVKNTPDAEYFGDDLLLCRQDGLIRPYPVIFRTHSKFLKSVGRPPSRLFEIGDLLSGMPNEFALASVVRSLPFYPWARMLAEAYRPWHYENVIKVDPVQVKSIAAKPSVLLFIEEGPGDIARLSSDEAIRRLRVLQQLEFGVDSDVLLNLSALVCGIPNMQHLHNVQESCISSVAKEASSFVISSSSQAVKILDSL